MFSLTAIQTLMRTVKYDVNYILPSTAILNGGCGMRKNTIFAISFFLIGLVVLFSYHSGDPVPGGDKYRLPEPREIDINGIPFEISWGFLEDENSHGIKYGDVLLNHNATVAERTFHQNDIILLDIKVYDFKGSDVSYEDLNKLNDGSWQTKSINGVDGIFKMESVDTYSGFVKNTHPRYYFTYIKDNKLVMIQCDKLNTLNDIVE
ncbi:hypothetical protein [uncultured Methanobrevibacter sp.]|uniref:hypothetical protein n=1 Tax=uncultured Methanobrevibacter sp. TaxID=253161 RepID=UPI002614C8EF|nr:hypothetical protein [uncultured Methanobrevibacter sp.]